MVHQFPESNLRTVLNEPLAWTQGQQEQRHRAAEEAAAQRDAIIEGQRRTEEFVKRLEEAEKQIMSEMHNSVPIQRPLMDPDTIGLDMLADAAKGAVRLPTAATRPQTSINETPPAQAGPDRPATAEELDRTRMPPPAPLRQTRSQTRVHEPAVSQPARPTTTDPKGTPAIFNIQQGGFRDLLTGKPIPIPPNPQPTGPNASSNPRPTPGPTQTKPQAPTPTQPRPPLTDAQAHYLARLLVAKAHAMHQRHALREQRMAAWFAAIPALPSTLEKRNEFFGCLMRMVELLGESTNEFAAALLLVDLHRQEAREGVGRAVEGAWQDVARGGE